MQRALFVATELPPGPGGIGAHAHQVALQLEQRGWSVVLMGPQDYVDDGEIEAWAARQRLSVERLRHLPTALLQGAWWGLRLLRVLGRFEPRVILASGRQMVWLTAVVTLMVRVPFISIGHGVEFGVRSRIARAINRWAYGRAATAVSVSCYTEGRMLASGVEPTEREVIPNGADQRAFSPLTRSQMEDWFRREELAQATRRLIITVGNVSQRKGQDLVVRALPRILERVPDVHYVMIGLPSRERELRRLALELGVEHHVHLLGRRPLFELRAYLSSSEIFVMASRHTDDGDFEGFGIAVVEAALLGLPAVVTRDSGLVEAIEPGRTGLAVASEEVDGLADAILELLADGDRRRAMGEAAQQRALAEQTWDRRGEQYHRLALRAADLEAAEGG